MKKIILYSLGYSALSIAFGYGNSKLVDKTEETAISNKLLWLVPLAIIGTVANVAYAHYCEPQEVKELKKEFPFF